MTVVGGGDISARLTHIWGALVDDSNGIIPSTRYALANILSLQIASHQYASSQIGFNSHLAHGRGVIRYRSTPMLTSMEGRRK